jgi:hypothetical protein
VKDLQKLFADHIRHHVAIYFENPSHNVSGVVSNVTSDYVVLSQGTDQPAYVPLSKIVWLRFADLAK